MGWRRGEIWFDAELRWFREASENVAASLELNAPAFAGLSPRVLATTIPNGLAESRRRRAELRRRRAARKTRAAAFVIGPAVAITLAGPRPVGASRGSDALREDPPSLASQQGVVPGGPVRAPRGRAEAPPASPSFPDVEWRTATSHGLWYAGALTGGTQLPLEGADWVTWNPVEDSVPNRPDRLYGHERTIRRIMSVVAAYREANPGAPRVVVGDISFPGGGPMELHRSHQNGLDVDVYYPRLNGRLRAPRTTSQIDRALAQDLLNRFVAAGAKMVFVGYSTGLRGPDEIVIPYPNHEDHMHVRFRTPSD